VEEGSWGTGAPERPLLLSSELPQMGAKAQRRGLSGLQVVIYFTVSRAPTEPLTSWMTELTLGQEKGPLLEAEPTPRLIGPGMYTSQSLESSLDNSQSSPAPGRVTEAPLHTQLPKPAGNRVPPVTSIFLGT
jgi:hypothetical protein